MTEAVLIRRAVAADVPGLSGLAELLAHQHAAYPWSVVPTSLRFQSGFEFGDAGL